MGLEPTRSCDHRHLKPCASANSAIPAFFQPACFALFAPLVDCSLIITQELDNVNRKIRKKLKKIPKKIF